MIKALLAMLLIGFPLYAWAVCGVPPVQNVCTPANFNPANPGASGFVLVQNDTFQNSSTIDMANSGNAGFHWYIRKFFGATTQPSGDFAFAAGGLTITPTLNTFNYQIGTAGPDASTKGWVGSVYSGGLYAEAVIAFDGPNVVAQGFNGWPAFWSMAVEHMAGKGAAQAPGQPTNYEHFGEDDFFEYDNSGDPTHTWGTALHDYFEYQNSGLHNPSCDTGAQVNSGSYCQIINVSGNGSQYTNAFSNMPGNPVITWNLSTFHTIGHLWISGGSSNGNRGYVQNFLDNVAANAGAGDFSPLSKTGWHTDVPLPVDLRTIYGNATNQAWQILDQDHMVVLIGTGVNEQMKVQAIRIWQIPGCGAVTH